MIEFNKHLDFYKDYPWADFSRLISYTDWGNKELAEKYLEKYWLPEQEYLRIWKPLQDKIFQEVNNLPSLVYHTDFELITLQGGCLFTEEDFKQLQAAMLELDESYFVVIQNSQEFTIGEPMFRMKFPVNITWEELISGNYISAVLLEMHLNEYLVFGSKYSWGKYAANDYKNPLDIIGFKPNLSPVFRKYFA